LFSGGRGLAGAKTLLRWFSGGRGLAGAKTLLRWFSGGRGLTDAKTLLRLVFWRARLGGRQDLASLGFLAVSLRTHVSTQRAWVASQNPNSSRLPAAAMWDTLQAKRDRVDALRPLSQDALANLEAWYDVELTYTSNAIEGNTLTRQETAIVLEKGITVRGKPLKDHQEAVDHLEAQRFVREIASRPRAVGEADVRDIHRLVVAGTLKAEAGVYSQHQRRIAGSRVVFPNPAKLPDLMREFGQQLAEATSPTNL